MSQDHDYDEEAAIKTAMALSILTIHDDDRRRKEKWGVNSSSMGSNSVDLSGKSLGSSMSSRSSAPVAMPIPRHGSAGNLLTKQYSHPGVHNSKSSPPSGNIIRPRPQSTKTTLSKDSGMMGGPVAVVWGTPSSTGTPPPLPVVGPNAKSCPFSDAASNLQQQAPAHSPRTTHRELTQPASVNIPNQGSSRNSLNPYNFEPQPLINLSPPTGQNLVDFDINTLDPLYAKSPSNITGRSTTGDAFQPKNEVANKGITICNPMFDFPRQSMASSSAANQIYANINYPQSGNTSGNVSPLQGTMKSALAIAPPPLQQPKALTDTLGKPSVSLRAPQTIYFAPNDLKVLGNGGHQPHCISGATPTHPTVAATADGTASSSSSTPSQSSTASYASTPQQVSTASSTSGDLMDFGIDEDDDDPMREFLSLEMFDPLYRVDQAATQGADTFETLGGASRRYEERQQTPTNRELAVVSPVLEEISASPSPPGEAIEEESDCMRPRAESTESEGELQDPFEMTALTGALEKKRARHAKEQVHREVLLRHKEPSEATTSRVEVAIKRQGILRHNSHMERGKEATYETLQEFHETADEEIRAFCQMVARLKQQYAADDPVTNRGLVISTRLKQPPYVNMTVKVVMQTDFSNAPVIFTCDLNSSIEHVISHVLLSLTDDLGRETIDTFIVKVHGLTEFMVNDSKLGDYEYVQTCLKLDQDIRLILCNLCDVPKSLLRTASDDRQPVFVPKHRDVDIAGMKVTKDKMNILMENFYREVERLRDNALRDGVAQVHCKSVIQSVKAVCAVLSKIETIDVIKAVNRLQTVTIDKTLRPASPKNPDSFVYVTDDGEGICSVVDSDCKKLCDLDDLHAALEDVTQSVKGLIEMYCRTFHTDFRFESAANVVRERKSLCSVRETLILHIASLHRIPLKWRSRLDDSFADYKVVCGLYHGGRRLCDEVSTQTTPAFTENFQDTLIWDEWIQFEVVNLAALPRETRLVFMLLGVRTVKSGAEEGQRITTPLGWVALQVFNHKFELAQGSQLLGLWPGEVFNFTGTSQSNTEGIHSILLQVNLPSFDFDVVFPPVGDLDTSLRQEFESLPRTDQERLVTLVNRSSVTSPSRHDTEFLWGNRHFLHTDPSALCKVLLAAPTWSYSSLVETYSMIVGWTALSPIEALEMLQPCFADTHVRTTAVKWLRELPDDELSNFLPQLVQALKFESYHNTALARFLLERSVCSIRIAHQLYWQLKEAAEDVQYRKRYQLVFGALLSVVGAAMRREFSKQEDLVKMLAAIAEKVKAAKEKEAVLQRELENMFDFLQRESIHLPINPSMEIVGVDAKSCSYFTSNAFPLKLVLKNVDPKAESIYTMFKVGDDLRQDMLTMQLISIMDKLWLRDGLDLKIITFRCQATGPKRGLVELVTESETLRKIQVKHGHGLTGSFKDGTIAEWLQLQNPTELEYQKAVDNFIASCAGYCVATYVLGIGDRHNDNIMIKQSGHMFHIDFGKFLGDAQMFGNIKRDRVPFVLTSDMAYVINGGDRPGYKFQQFVDLCCQAFNILRKHNRLFLNLFSLMVRSGIPGVNVHAAKYVHRTLLPDQTVGEATALFTRMIEESLKSMSTQINFFFHNLAQMKFSGHSEGALLSFIPKTYSLATDGKIKNIEVFGYQKRYNPEKYYIYIIKVDRENQKVPSFIFRRYSEFQEFHHKLIVLFPLAKLPSLAGKVLLGRTHVKTVADARKLELEKFLRQLLQLAPEISEHGHSGTTNDDKSWHQCDLVYTFFHPMLRDEQDIDKNLHKLKGEPVPRPAARAIQGQVKLSMIYKNDALTIMIMHVKNLGMEGDEVPSPYVKTYLLPDPMKYTKRKTRIVKGTFYPTFNEVLMYPMPIEAVRAKTLQVTVWNYNALEENDFFGACHIRLADIELTKETTDWFKLQTLHTLST